MTGIWFGLWSDYNTMVTTPACTEESMRTMNTEAEMVKCIGSTMATVFGLKEQFGGAALVVFGGCGIFAWVMKGGQLCVLEQAWLQSSWYLHCGC